MIKILLIKNGIIIEFREIKMKGLLIMKQRGPKNRRDGNSKQSQREPLPANKKTRRSFINILFGGSLFAFIGSVVYPIFRFLNPPKDVGEATPNSIFAGTVYELEPNSGKIIKFGRKPVILIRTPSGDLKAFSAICTHLECIVQYRKDFEHIWCACHNGHYNLNGINIAGPPPRPLASFEVNIKEDKIFISKKD
jgi:Rieske Fe-S protein